MELDSFSFVLLRRPDEPTEYAEGELARIQQAHLAHLSDLSDRGVMRLAGPFDGQPDESWRGMCIFACDPDEARRLMDEDPAVRAGRLEPVVWRWFTVKGALGG